MRIAKYVLIKNELLWTRAFLHEEEYEKCRRCGNWKTMKCWCNFCEQYPDEVFVDFIHNHRYNNNTIHYYSDNESDDD